MKRLRPGAVGVAAAVFAAVVLVSLARQAWQPHRDASIPPAESRLLNINQATVLEWTVLSGIGPVLAGRIVRLRKARGGFGSIDELQLVKGLGEKKMGRIRPRLTLGVAEPD